MTVSVAVPFDPTALEKLAFIVNKCCEHRAWFSDTDWALGDTHRRALVIRRLSDIDSASWEVYRGADLVGILHADEIVPKQDARCHFLFFDRELRDKRQLCRATMAHLFARYELHVLRAEIPTYANKLLGFTRKACGFRFESEARAFSWPSSAAPLTADVARLGSRKHHAILHQGVWHDLLLLSVTRDEFEAAAKDDHHWSDPTSAETDGTRLPTTRA